jgi:hypothetical protein
VNLNFFSVSLNHLKNSFANLSILCFKTNGFFRKVNKPAFNPAVQLGTLLDLDQLVHENLSP